MSIIEAIILGGVQGLAEFLPISSSGHLQIAKEALGIALSDNLTFDIMLHVATVLATIVVLWREILELFKGAAKGISTRKMNHETACKGLKMNTETAYFLKILLSMLPVAAIGLLLKDQLNAMLSSPQVLVIVGIMLLLTAALLAFANFAKERQKTGISYRDALLIGVAQAVAAMPGLSRSGATIATGLMLGNKKSAVAQFSFLMVIVPILGEALLDVLRGDFSAGLGVGVWPLVAGFATAFVVGALACKFMIEMVKRSKLIWFSAYCAIVGAATIIYYFL